MISREVIEIFAPRFLADPGVIWLSESGNKVVKRDDDVARAVRLDIDQQRVLPDIILVDDGAPLSPLFVFVEVVASDGPITVARKEALLALVTAGGTRRSTPSS